MADKIDPRFLREAGTELFNGNELLVKGALETAGGVHLLTGYPGSPVAQFFDIIEENAALFRSRGIHAAIANNEAISVAMVNGSQMAPCRAMSVFKSVGGHVASDALALGNLAGAHPQGGVVVVYGDDPWSETTQVPADSRYLSKHLRIPVLEPADLQECKDWIELGFRLSAASELYIGYMYTTPQAEGGGSVVCRPNHYPAVNAVQRATLDPAGFNLDERVLLPPRTGRMEARIPERFVRLHRHARLLRVNRLLHEPPGAVRVPLGFVSSGMPYCYLEHALADLGLTGRFPILKLGITYPLDARQIEQFAAMCENVVVIEDRRGFVEEQIADIVIDWNQGEGAGRPAKVWGKKFPHGLPGTPELWGLNPSLLVGRLAPMLEKVLPRAGSRAAAKAVSDSRADRAAPEYDPARFREAVEPIELAGRPAVGLAAELPKIPVRTPTFCPGCPHRDSSSVLLEIKRLFADAVYMKARHKREPVDLVFHGDTGCYTMLMFEPNQALMHNYSGMGLGGGTGAGIDPFITNKQVVFMGDSTFFHSGQIAVSNSIKNNQDITYVILDNKTTAMTGHQSTPGVDADLLGRPTFAQDIERIVRALAPDKAIIRTVNPEDRDRWKQLLETTILADGVKVLIADKECGITYHRRKNRDDRAVERRIGYLPRKTFINITPEVCEDCRVCTTTTGCPGLNVVPTDYGPKVQTDLTTCVSDGACFRAGGLACPSFEFVTVRRRKPASDRIGGINLAGLPEPEPRLLRPGTGDSGAADASPVWRAYLAGVGGMGIGMANGILVHAGHRQGYRVMFSEKRGLAIRNGGVFSQVIYAAGDAVTSSVIPAGRADLLFGVDLLEAARSVDPASAARVGSPKFTHAVLNTRKTPTVTGLTGKEDFDPAALVEGIRRRVRPEPFFAEEVSEVCQKLLGSTLYANIMLLGVSWQLGLIPVTLANMLAAIRACVRADLEKNLTAFHVGRKMVVHPEVFDFAPRPQSCAELIEEKCAAFRKEYRFRGPGMAAGYKALVEKALAPMGALDDGLRRAFALRIYDCWQYDGRPYARRYAALVRFVFDHDRAGFGWRATRAAIENLHRVMIIKDEPYVAYLLTSVEKLERDARRYDVDPARGDAIKYLHINKPEFNLFGMRVRLPFALHTRNWMLRLVRRATFLRRGKWGPFHHPEEEAFRDWYIELVEGFRFADAAGYDRYVAVLRTPEAVKGYREIREPGMAAARAQAARLLAEIPARPATGGSAESVGGTTTEAAADGEPQGPTVLSDSRF
jgi:indolepyruvate ferredoxin oxidoreductase